MWDAQFSALKPSIVSSCPKRAGGEGEYSPCLKIAQSGCVGIFSSEVLPPSQATPEADDCGSNIIDQEMALSQPYCKIFKLRSVTERFASRITNRDDRMSRVARVALCLPVLRWTHDAATAPPPYHFMSYDWNSITSQVVADSLPLRKIRH